MGEEHWNYFTESPGPSLPMQLNNIGANFHSMAGECSDIWEVFGISGDSHVSVHL